MKLMQTIVGAGLFVYFMKSKRTCIRIRLRKRKSHLKTRKILSIYSVTWNQQIKAVLGKDQLDTI